MISWSVILLSISKVIFGIGGFHTLPSACPMSRNVLRSNFYSLLIWQEHFINICRAIVINDKIFGIKIPVYFIERTSIIYVND